MPKLPNGASNVYLWMGMILLPVAGLAFAGFLSLRQDKFLIEQEAREKAKKVAEALVGTLRLNLTNDSFPGFRTNWSSGALYFQTGLEGELHNPPPVEALAAPEKFVIVPSQVQELWNSAEKAEFEEENFAKAIEAWSRIESELQKGVNARSIASFRKGIGLYKAGEIERGFNALVEMANEKTKHNLPNGVSIRWMAILKLLESPWPSRVNQDEEDAIVSNWAESVV